MVTISLMLICASSPVPQLVGVQFSTQPRPVGWTTPGLVSQVQMFSKPDGQIAQYQRTEMVPV